MSVSDLSARSSLELLREGSPAPSIQSIPDSLPPAVAGAMVWEGSQLQKYVFQLSASEIAEIRAAIISFKNKTVTGLGREAINQTTFPLSSKLAAHLRGLSEQVHNGSGVAVLRGLDAARFNDEEAVIAFVGISSYVSPLRATDSYANQTLSHVRDATHDEIPPWAKDIGLAGSKITSAMEFHSDRFSGDIIALHIRNDGGAQKGGEQYVSSGFKIYNELLETDPSILETLQAPNWPFELKQKDKAPYEEKGPILFFSKGRPIFQLVKAPLLGSPRIPRDPSMANLTAEQLHALQVVEGLASRFATKIDRQQGDIQYINNLSVMHARSAYGDENKRSTRHLLRMFLRDPQYEWQKPISYSRQFDDPFAPGRRQEIPVIDNDPWRKISGRESHG